MSYDTPLVAPTHPTPLHAETARRLEEIDGFLPVGGPIDPGQGFFERTLPESIYSAVFMIPLSVSNQQLFEWSAIVEYWIPILGAYGACVGAQSGVVFYFVSMVNEMKDSEACVDHVSLGYICLGIFMAAVLREFFETVSIVAWTKMIPVWQESDKAISEHAMANSGLTNLPHQMYENKAEFGDQQLAKPAHGITNRCRCLIYFALVPKVAISCIMFWYGSGHVLLSENAEEIILNTVATIFVFEIDDYIYAVSVPHLKKFWMMKSATFQVAEEETTGFENVAPFYVAAIFLAISIFGMHARWC